MKKILLSLTLIVFQFNTIQSFAGSAQGKRGGNEIKIAPLAEHKTMRYPNCFSFFIKESNSLVKDRVDVHSSCLTEFGRMKVGKALEPNTFYHFPAFMAPAVIEGWESVYGQNKLTEFVQKYRTNPENATRFYNEQHKTWLNEFYGGNKDYSILKPSKTHEDPNNARIVIKHDPSKIRNFKKVWSEDPYKKNEGSSGSQ